MDNAIIQALVTIVSAFMGYGAVSEQLRDVKRRLGMVESQLEILLQSKADRQEVSDMRDRLTIVEASK